MAAPEKVAQLVEVFARNIDVYKTPNYNETQVRREFIDPLFEALGWDVSNTAGYAQAYKDVIHEDAIKVGGITKAPDYCFRIGGTRKFFLEAKKPSIDIKGGVSPAYQLRRYAWSAKLPISVLTDFEEFAVYDCRTRPKQSDKASTSRIIYLTYDQYLEEWDSIASILSKDAVLKGSFDKFAADAKLHKGTATVDVAFLAEIDSWREMLAKDIALRNRTLTKDEIGFVVQRTIDRIIFLRMCEDRGIETDTPLQALIAGPRIYPRLCELFDKADAKYNSGLFHFHKEPGRAEPPDELTTSVTIQDTPLKWIIHSLYYPQCPYEFSVFPVEILGNVYEQFLGKVITLKTSRQVKIEDKPEVKKAGGVYYTPAYIVDYIVKNTVGKLIEDKTPKQIEKIKVLDPACGSGSFLIGAYSYLLTCHRDWYVAHNPEKHTKQIYQGPGAQWYLTIAEKKKILLNNIFGVDIDSQAVEVTKLSLLLKVLEHETRDSVDNQYRLYHERALPDLANNIKCGNSLIAPDFYDDEANASLTEEEQRKINAFDWKKEFPKIFSAKKPGFDAVIGNPPYLFITQVPAQQRSYFSRAFSTVSYRFDLYGAFIENASIRLLQKSGVLGFIIPHTLLSNDSFSSLRALLAATTTVDAIVDLGPGVFQNARNETMLIFFTNNRPINTPTTEVIRTLPNQLHNPYQSFKAIQARWMMPPGKPWLVHLSPGKEAVLDKMRAAQERLGNLCHINQGLRTGDNDKYLSSSRHSSSWKVAAGGKQIGRYATIPKTLYVRYVPKLLDAPRREQLFTTPAKLVVQEIRNITLERRIIATLDSEQVYCLQSTNVVNAKPLCSYDLRYLLGVLNSTAVNFFFRSSFPGNNHIPSNQLAQIPTPQLDLSNPSAKALHDQMVHFVQTMLDLSKKLQTAKTAHDKTLLERRIAATDNQIDQLVYKLYDLTPEETAIVEGTSKL